MMNKILTIMAAGILLLGCQTIDDAKAGIEIIDGPRLEKVTPWYKGDIVGAQSLCIDEEAIMKIVMADTKSEDEVRRAMYFGSMAGECILLPQAIGVLVIDIVTEYIDFAKRPSVVMVVALPKAISGGVAYIIAGGRRGPPKEEKGKAI